METKALINIKALKLELKFKDKKSLDLKAGIYVFLRTILQEHKKQFFSYIIHLGLYYAICMCGIDSVSSSYSRK